MFRYEQVEEFKKHIPQELHGMYEKYGHYVLKLLKVKQEKDLIMYDLANVRGIRYDKERTTFNQDQANEIYFKLSEKLEEKEKELAYYKNYITGINWVYQQIEDKELKQNIYNAFMFNDNELALSYGVKI